MKRKQTKQILVFCLAIITLYSCFPGDDLSVEEYDIVATDFMPVYFANNAPTKYFMPDTVGQIGINPGEATNLTREQMDFILSQVERNFDELGYERIVDALEADNLPDVIVTVNQLTVTTVGVGCLPWWGWWGWYPWYPGWGWGPGYCYPAYGYSYTTGTVTIDMLSPTESSNSDNLFNRVWEAGINGLLRSTEAGNQTFVRERIDEAFELSPYLAP